MTDYYDLDMAMDQNIYGDIDIKTDVDAIEQAILDILLTRVGEREEMPLYGSHLYETLMQKMSNLTTIQVKNDISQALVNWEPRVDLKEVSVKADQEAYTYHISIRVYILRINLETTFNLVLDSIQ